MKLRDTLMAALLAAITLVAVPSSASAQAIASVKPIVATGSLTTSTCVGASISSTGCTGVTMGGYTHVSVQLTGTWSGVITFESSVDSGTTWVTQNMLPSTGTQTAVTSSTGNGVWYAQQAISVALFRARFSTPTSGTVVVTVRATL